MFWGLKGNNAGDSGCILGIFAVAGMLMGFL